MFIFSSLDSYKCVYGTHFAASSPNNHLYTSVKKHTDATKWIDPLHITKDGIDLLTALNTVRCIHWRQWEKQAWTNYIISYNLNNSDYQKRYARQKIKQITIQWRRWKNRKLEEKKKGVTIIAIEEWTPPWASSHLELD